LVSALASIVDAAYLMTDDDHGTGRDEADVVRAYDARTCGFLLMACFRST
jgi:hypothetical protein